MTWKIFLAFALIGAAGLYIFLRWRRSPKAYKAMIAVSVASFVSGSILSAWVFRLSTTVLENAPRMLRCRMEV
jgi:multidrug resistance efflux pump